MGRVIGKRMRIVRRRVMRTGLRLTPGVIMEVSDRVEDEDAG